ncbi:MAG: undecaprenyl-diphosphate phosphatase [Armatimonadetes bacterium]|nr:undecaprenyl-diphosphate phosphatase [Armatimonadota bacterium]
MTRQQKTIGVRRAAALGAVQGLTEFLPVSSSAHTVLLSRLMRWPRHSLDVDIVLHLGCLAGLLAALRHDWLALLQGAAAGNALPLLWVAVACLPAVVAGVLVEGPARACFRRPWQVAALTLLMGGVLIAVDQFRPAAGVHWQPGGRDAVVVGLAQALAFLPGVSRSGITIAAGVVAGLSLPAAVRFSFLLGVPILAGAGVWGLRDLPRRGIPRQQRLPLAVGFAVSAVVGYAAAAWMLRAVAHLGLTPFGVYRVVLGLLLLRGSTAESPTGTTLPPDPD